MKRREKILLFVLLLIVASFAIVFFKDRIRDGLRTFLRAETELDASIAQRQALLATRDTWEARDNWLSKNVPPLPDSEPLAQGALRTELESLAQKHSVQLPVLKPGSLETDSLYPSLEVQLEATGTYEALLAFLIELQDQEAFRTVPQFRFPVGTPKPNAPLKAALTLKQSYAPPPSEPQSP